MCLGDADRGVRDRVRERERVGDLDATDRRGEAECAESGWLGDLVCDLSRVGLRVCERAGEGDRDVMIVSDIRVGSQCGCEVQSQCDLSRMEDEVA